MFLRYHATFFGLTKKEIKILGCIEDIPKNIYRIGKETDIPRATLYPIIEDLYGRGFIIPKKLGQRFLYQTIPEEKLLRIMVDLVKELDRDTPVQTIDQKPEKIEQEKVVERRQPEAKGYKNLFKKFLGR